MNPDHITEWMLALPVALVAVAVIVAVVRHWRAARLHRRIGASIATLDHSDVLAIVCEPCNGGSGRCTCASKCGDWLCGADDTGIGSWTDAELAFLHGHRETPDG